MRVWRSATILAYFLTTVGRIDNFVAGKEFVGEDRSLDRILRRLKLHAEGRQFGGQNSRARRAHQVAHADSLERRRFRDSRQWQTAPFQTRYRRLAGFRRHRQGDQEGKVAEFRNAPHPGQQESRGLRSGDCSTLNVQRSTLSAQFRELDVGCWALSVGRFLLSGE